MSPAERPTPTPRQRTIPRGGVRCLVTFSNSLYTLCTALFLYHTVQYNTSSTAFLSSQASSGSSCNGSSCFVCNRQSAPFTLTSYANVPPKSTWRGPTVAGSAGGFFGVLFGSAIFFFLCCAVAFFFYRRHRIRNNQPILPWSKSRRGDTTLGAHRRLGERGEDPWLSSISLHEPSTAGVYGQSRGMQSTESVGFDKSRLDLDQENEASVYYRPLEDKS